MKKIINNNQIIHESEIMNYAQHRFNSDIETNVFQSKIEQYIQNVAFALYIFAPIAIFIYTLTSVIK